MKFTRAISLFLIVNLTFSPYFSYSLSRVQAKELTSKDIAGIAEHLEKRFFPLVEDLLGVYPRETFDVSYRAALLPKSVKTIFEWVRDRTFLVPYQGQLRGARGVLMDRRGNSLDRALLLQELLREKGFEARLVRGDLGPDISARLLDEAPLYPEDGLDEASPEFDELEWLKLSNRYGLTDVPDESYPKHQAVMSVMEDLIERVIETSNALGELGLRPAASSDRARALTDLSDHWWVQYQEGGDWIDLDPSLPNARPGERLTEPRMDEVSQALLHRVRIKVIVERWEKDMGLVEEVALDQSVSPMNYMGKAFTLVHEGANLQSFVKADSSKKFEENLLSQDTWLPVLRVVDKSAVGQEIDAFGQLSTPSTDPEVRRAKKTRETLETGWNVLNRVMEGTNGQAQKESNHDNPAWTAQWLEFEVTSPGREPRRTRRTVFDLIGEAQRTRPLTARPALTDEQKIGRALALLSQVRFVLLCSDINPDFGTVEALTSTLAQRERVMRVIKSESTDPTELLKLLSGDEPFPSSLMGLISLRRLIGPQSLSYIDSPGILAQVKILDRHEGQIYARSGIDFVVGSIGIHPRAGTKSATMRFQQGIMDTWAETKFLDQSAFFDEELTEVENTAVFFAQRDALGSQWRTIKSKDDQAWQEIALDDDERVRLEAVLESGFWIVLPKEKIQFDGRRVLSWWQFDPTSGDILGMGGRGHGQAMWEYRKVIGVGTALIVGLFTFLGCAGGPEWAGGQGYDEVSRTKIALCITCGVAAAIFTYISVLGAIQGIKAASIGPRMMGMRGAFISPEALRQALKLVFAGAGVGVICNVIAFRMR